MSEFWIYFRIGLNHVLDIQGYDHLLFLTALTVPNTFKEWKKVLLLVSVFTLGHTLALFLSLFGILRMNAEIVEFLIPITIFVAAVYGIFTAGKSAKTDKAGAAVFLTLFFGIIHGLGFSNYFNSILSGKAGEKLIPLLEFALGIEVAQIIVVLAVLVLAYLAQTFFKLSKRDWVLVASALVAGMVLPMIIGNEIWSKWI